MPEFCDVASARAADHWSFTYAVPDGMQPVVGGRVLVPFRQQRMSGIVTALHDRKPKVKTKNVISVLDAAPVLDEQLIQLGPVDRRLLSRSVGEVFRTMLPLGRNSRRTIGYRITEEGHMALHLAGMSGSSARSQKTPEDQLAEFRVLDYLAEREMTREESSAGCDPGVAGRCSREWCARSGLCAKICPSRETRPAPSEFAVLKNCRRQAQRQSANSDRHSRRRRRQGACRGAAVA